MIGKSRAPAEYRRLFQARDVPFLASCVFVDGYAPLEVLVTYAAPIWTSYLPIVVEEKTLRDGLALYSTPGAFQQLQRNFLAYRERSRTFFEAVLKQPRMTREQTVTFCAYASEIFSYYAKTEFFYTNDLYHQSLHNDVIAKNIHELGPFKLEARAYMNTFFLTPDCYRKRFSCLLGTQFGLSAENLEQYASQEIPELFDGVRVNAEVVRARGSRYVSCSDGMAVFHVHGEEAARSIERFASESDARAGVVRGVCANPGTAVGRVRIFHLELASQESVRARIRAMAKGDVLVAETTGPEIMEACQKAGAIVTNQGGMLSHAAIVSRELGIPCIIATGNATDVLKDGDTVEVDAEKGMVRVVRRAKSC